MKIINCIVSLNFQIVKTFKIYKLLVCSLVGMEESWELQIKEMILTQVFIIFVKIEIFVRF